MRLNEFNLPLKTVSDCQQSELSQRSLLLQKTDWSENL